MSIYKRRAEGARDFAFFALVPLVAFLLVVFIPFLLGLYMTFTDSSGLSLSANFMGLENYAKAVADASFWTSFAFTAKYVLVSVLATNALALGLSLLATAGIRGQNALRLGYFTPNLIGGIILGFIWQFLFAKVFTSIGTLCGGGALSESWLTSPGGAFWALVLVGVWQNSGYMMLIYIAGLAGIDKALLEAAQMEGAGYWTRLRKVILPLLAPSATISVFLTLQRGFMVYDVNLSLTQGGPYRSTELIAMHIYNEAFLYQRFQTGQAKALILFALLAAASLIQVGLMKRREIES
jgi:raffinose/stachyose/melibiose transport system permease protein